MKLNLKKINYHKWIPSRFSSFQAKLLIAFLVATLLPLTLVALVSYHGSSNLARDRITNSALMSDEQLIFPGLHPFPLSGSRNDYDILHH